MQVDILYPEIEAERRILIETTGIEDARAENVLQPTRLGSPAAHPPRARARGVVEAILKLVRSARPGQ